MITQPRKYSECHVIPRYNVTNLGAPFTVTLVDSVAYEEGGYVIIPDLAGMISAVVRARATHPRKFNGADCKFVRNALGVKSKSLANFLEISPEHLSRCEGGSKVMSSSTEKVFRFFAVMASFYDEPEELLERIGSEIEVDRKPDSSDEDMSESFVKNFFSLKIQNVFDASEQLEFELSRCLKHVDLDVDCKDEKWSPTDSKVA